MSLAALVYNQSDVHGVVSVDSSVATVFTEIANFDVGHDSYMFLLDLNHGKTSLLFCYSLFLVVNSLPNNKILAFNDSEQKSCCKQSGKRRNAGIFSFSHNVYHPIKERNQHLIKIEFFVCK